MLNFCNFISEKNLELLKESKISFSKNFLNVLRSIDSPLAKKISDLNTKDVDIQYNFVDTTKDNDMVSFTPDRKAQEILAGKSDLYKVINSGRYLTGSIKNQHIYDALNHIRTDNVYQPETETVGKILRETLSPRGNIYCLFECVSTDDDNGKRTILNKEALEPYDESLIKVWSSNRNNIKIGRIIRAIVSSSKIETSDSEIEQFVNQYKSTIDVINDAFNRFEIVEAKDITFWYSHENYSNMRGTLGNSCMAHSPGEYFHIYSKNPEVCKLVILYDDKGRVVDGKYKSDKIKGRALLWKVEDNSGSSFEFMDRIYTNSDSDQDLFKQFATRNNFWHKKVQNSDENFDMIKGQEVKKDPVIVVNLKSWTETFPYVDTLKFFNLYTGELSNSPSQIGADAILNCTGGGYDNW